MKGRNSFKKDLLTVLISNCIVLAGNIVTGFVVPRILGVTEYGYYKIFTLYLGYVSLLHFGFVDGILLEYAGKEYSDIDKTHMKQKSVFYIRMELIISALIIAGTVLFVPEKYKYLIILLGIDTFAVNLTSYFQYVSQSTSRFKELSIRKILLSLFKLILAVMLFVFVRIELIDSAKANYYVTGLVVIDLALTGWYVFTYRDIVFGERVTFTEEKDDIVKCFKAGIILTVSYQVTHLIFTLDRQFVSVLFDTDTYSIYSFAYHLISMVTTIINAVALVLFPALKKKQTTDIVASYPDSISMISIVALGALIGYYPVKVIIGLILPDYIGSIEYIRIIFPGLAVTCCINIIMFTYYKALNQHIKFFGISCIILIIAAATNYCAYSIFRNPSAISVASIITLLIWYFTSDAFFVRHYETKWKKNAAYILILMISFYTISCAVKSDIVFTAIYVAVYLIITYIFHKQLIIKHLPKRFVKP